MFKRELSPREKYKSIAVVGSATYAPSINHHIDKDTIIIALNNAHKACSRIDFSLYPEDFPTANRHPDCIRIGRTHSHYIDFINRHGGLSLCGATIAFNAGYWILETHPFAQVGFYGCDMVYGEDSDQQHFYGKGVADPLRRNISLNNLQAKSSRLFYIGLTKNIYFFNCSPSKKTSLSFPKKSATDSFTKPIKQSEIEYFTELRSKLEPYAKKAFSLEKSGYISNWKYPSYYKNDANAWSQMQAIDEAWSRVGEFLSNNG